MNQAVTPLLPHDEYVSEALADATHAFNFLKDSGTLAASLVFNVAHRVPGHDQLLSLRFPQPWARDNTITHDLSVFSERLDNPLHETRLEADTLIHAHTPYLTASSLSDRPFPILYVAAARHILAREIPNHLERTRSVIEVIRERLDRYPELAPPPGLLESNGGANFWGRGIVKTAERILLIEESARIQAIAEQIGGAQSYTPGALALQWKRTGLLEQSKAYVG
jgi:L-ribulose-5-phosphate 4-epimerase